MRFENGNCIPNEERCDGVRNCAGGEDEEECTILARTFGKDMVSYNIY